jgi:integrase
MADQRKLPEGMTQRGNVYWADFQTNGRRVRKSLSKNLKTAKQLLVELRSRAERGEYGLLDNDVPVKEIRKQYLRHCRQTLKPGTVRRYEYSLDAILPELPQRVSRFTVAAVVSYRERRLAAGVSPRTINMDVGALSTMLRWAVKPAGLIGHNPLQGIKPLPHDHPKESRALTANEVKGLLDASPPLWRDIWYAFLVTGMRKNELASLTFADIDWEAREIVVQRGIAKNHNARRIQIDNGLWPILCRQRDESKARQPGKGRTAEITARVRARFTRDHVFTTTQNTPLTHGSGLYHAFIRCCRLAGVETRREDDQGREIDHVDVHSLRRTFATDLIANGADPKSVQALLGHKTLAMTMNLYAKVHSETKRQALGRLSYGAGVQAPEHVLQFPPKDGDRHNFPTVRSGKRAAST